MGWISDRRISRTEWKLQKLRFGLIKLLAGDNCVAINLAINRNGVIGYPPTGRCLFFHKTTITIDGHDFDLEEVIKSNVEA